MNTNRFIKEVKPVDPTWVASILIPGYGDEATYYALIDKKHLAVVHGQWVGPYFAFAPGEAEVFHLTDFQGALIYSDDWDVTALLGVLRDLRRRVD